MRLLKAHILDDANWNPRRPKKESWNEAGSLELLDRLLATAGSFIFAICFGPQIIIFPVCFSFLYAAQVIENPLRNAWVAYWAIACAVDHCVPAALILLRFVSCLLLLWDSDGGWVPGGGDGREMDESDEGCRF